MLALPGNFYEYLEELIKYKLDMLREKSRSKKFAPSYSGGSSGVKKQVDPEVPRIKEMEFDLRKKELELREKELDRAYNKSQGYYKQDEDGVSLGTLYNLVNYGISNTGMQGKSPIEPIGKITIKQGPQDEAIPSNTNEYIPFYQEEEEE